MKLSDILSCALQRVDEHFEADFYLPGGDPRQFDYLGLMRRMHSHIKNHPDSVIKKFPELVGDSQPKKSIQKITEKELDEALQEIEKEKLNFRLDKSKGLLAVQRHDNEVEVFTFKIAA